MFGQPRVRILISILALCLFAGFTQGLVIEPFCPVKVPDVHGDNYAVITWPEGTHHEIASGLVDVIIAKRRPSADPVLYDQAAVLLTDGLYKSVDLEKVAVTQGDRVFGRLRGIAPPQTCLVSAKGKGLVLIAEYGAYNMLRRITRLLGSFLVRGSRLIRCVLFHYSTTRQLRHIHNCLVADLCLVAHGLTKIRKK